MIVLAIDTVSRSGSVALMDEAGMIGQMTLVSRETHSRHLMGMIDALLTAARKPLTAVDAFGVAVGPGSFTGVRIGISAVKGMAVSTDRPVIGVSSLAALSEPFRYRDGLVCSMLDARRGEVYGAIYRVNRGTIHPETPEMVVSPGELLAQINDVCLFTGDGTETYGKTIHRHLGARAVIAPAYQRHIQAAAVGHLAMAALNRGETPAAADLKAVYLRKSDAEKALAKRGRQPGKQGNGFGEPVGG